MVKVTVCKDAFEGEVVKGLLAENGIDCYLQNENMSQVYGSIQAMEINVMVKEEDAEKAKELLATRPEAEPIVDYKPQMKRKSIKRLLIESFFIAVIIIAFALISALARKEFETFYIYVIYAVGGFLGYFLVGLLFRK